MEHKLVYRKPEIKEYGSLKSITKGSGSGNTESPYDDDS
jgi:hypothetical protein